MNYNCERCGDHLGWREHQGPTLCERCRLRAEVERLRTNLETALKNNDPLVAEVERLRGELEREQGLTKWAADAAAAGQAEVEKLRAALEAIVQVDEISAGESWEDAFYDVAGIARAALAKEDNDVQSG